MYGCANAMCGCANGIYGCAKIFMDVQMYVNVYKWYVCLNISMRQFIIAFPIITFFFPGDLYVYDLTFSPWALLKVVHNYSKQDHTIISISWSLDNTKIITQNNQVCHFAEGITLSVNEDFISEFIHLIIYIFWLILCGIIQ